MVGLLAWSLGNVSLKSQCSIHAIDLLLTHPNESPLEMRTILPSTLLYQFSCQIDALINQAQLSFPKCLNSNRTLHNGQDATVHNQQSSTGAEPPNHKTQRLELPCSYLKTDSYLFPLLVFSVSSYNLVAKQPQSVRHTQGKQQTKTRKAKKQTAVSALHLRRGSRFAR